MTEAAFSVSPRCQLYCVPLTYSNYSDPPVTTKGEDGRVFPARWRLCATRELLQSWANRTIRILISQITKQRGPENEVKEAKAQRAVTKLWAWRS